MSDTVRTTALDTALRNLQAALESTRVPGELADWLAPLQQALQELRRTLEGELQAQRRDDFRVIQKDVSLLPRIAQLQAEDEEIHRITLLAETLAAKTATILNQSKDQDEAVLTIQELSELAHSLAIRAKSQEQAITTWFVESIQRDRGVVD